MMPSQSCMLSVSYQGVVRPPWCDAVSGHLHQPPTRSIASVCLSEMATTGSPLHCLYVLVFFFCDPPDSLHVSDGTLYCCIYAFDSLFDCFWCLRKLRHGSSLWCHISVISCPAIAPELGAIHSLICASSRRVTCCCDIETFCDN